MDGSYTALEPLPVSRRHVENCRYSNWYHLFPGHVPLSRVIKPLPAEFVRYLEQDGIRLPDPEQVKSFYTQGVVGDEENEYSDWSENEEDESSSEKAETMDPLKDFPELHETIGSIIRELGAVAPKLNWSAPRDATWILPNNTMKCSEINELYLLLNASNYISFDLQHGFDECADEGDDSEGAEFELVLRQWFDINPALEFRVFVKDGRLLGVSQRDLNYYSFLEPLVEDFKDVIDEFVSDVFLTKFTEKACVLDVYIPRPFNKLYLIDINPFSRTTDSLLFSWNELLSEDTDGECDYELRIVSENNVGRFASKEHSENQVPKDIVDASLDPESIRELTEKWRDLLRHQEAEDSDGSEKLD
ncbi:hypothetical protein HG536_0B04950 [Torulaspora globosa]|uniref:Translation initiation factor eIF2 assembly protein n=1 Tax=Torulaspora globosa TaxID=48254 RepID=A0A7G3ZDP5_9SACH|nr:uncharacterized protein HG536_0B04950 [Torulaspora globosa]QLL31631.1 hypothetical protein HG536_0B04950 [Torulaspora globosa]